MLFSIFFAINIGIGAFFVYYKYMNRNKENDPGEVNGSQWHGSKWEKSNKWSLKIELIIFTTT